MPRRRAEELTYYDELGVARNAAPDEIRDSFRALVRLIHPDHQTDPNLKAVAELQMRKLNRIHEVLSDPARRQEYDDYLEEDHSPASPLLSDRLSALFGSGDPGKANQLIGQLTWVGAVGLAVILLVWLAAEGSVAPSIAPAEKTPAVVKLPESGAKPPDAARELAQAQADLKIARFERDAAIRELTKLRRTPAAQPATGSNPERRADPLPYPAVATLTELPTNNQPVPGSPVMTPATRLPVPRPVIHPFGGFWFYLRAPEEKNKNAGLYPPEFIEASIVEQNGQVRGRYRSRYRIVDRAISPDVNFEFSGIITAGVVTATWTGPGGARGEITMKLLSDNSMKIDWTADQLGSIQGLTSGTAALTRRLD